MIDEHSDKAEINSNSETGNAIFHISLAVCIKLYNGINKLAHLKLGFNKSFLSKSKQTYLYSSAFVSTLNKINFEYEIFTLYSISRFILQGVIHNQIFKKVNDVMFSFKIWG